MEQVMMICTGLIVFGVGVLTGIVLALFIAKLISLKE
jgi:hypothetical protein